MGMSQVHIEKPRPRAGLFVLDYSSEVTTVKVEKEKLDAVLGKLLATPPKPNEPRPTKRVRRAKAQAAPVKSSQAPQ